MKQQQSGVDQDLSSFEVSNRHLTGWDRTGEDQANPCIRYGQDEDFSAVLEEGCFPQGRANVKVWALLGYTEIGSGDQVGETADDSQIPISYGHTPEDIRRACLLLAIRYMLTIDDADALRDRARVTSESNRDQSYTMTAWAGASSDYGMTGDVEVDTILMRYPRPLGIGGA
jgi:hypothetical protein